MAAADSSSIANDINDIGTNPNSNPDSSKAIVAVPNSSKATVAFQSVHPGVCLWQFAGNSLSGAVMGFIFGYGTGVFKKKGFRGSVGEAGSHAKSFAVLSGVHSLVACFLKRLRGKDDVINSGIAGCCTGLALSFPGAPSTLLTSCISFGAFSFIMDGLNKQKPALAHSLSVQNKSAQFAVPPSLALPLPDELKDAFSSFCKSLRKPNKNGVRVTH